MSEAWQPTLRDLAQAFDQLADRVDDDERMVLEPYVEQAMRDAIFHLELYIPGLEPPFDAEPRARWQRAAAAALERGRRARRAGPRAARPVLRAARSRTVLRRRLRVLRGRRRRAGAAPAVPHAVDPSRAPRGARATWRRCRRSSTTPTSRPRVARAASDARVRLSARHALVLHHRPDRRHPRPGPRHLPAVRRLDRVWTRDCSAGGRNRR